MSFPNLSELSIRRGAVTLFFLLLSIAIGTHTFVNMGRAEDPSFTLKVMVVSALWPGADPATLRDQVVDRLEKRIQEVGEIFRIDSTIRPGRADIVVEFRDHASSQQVRALRYDVRRRMQDEAPLLPPGVVGPIVNEDFADVYFSLLALTAPGLQQRVLVREAEAIRDRLQAVPGVHKALVLGERSRRVYVDVDNDRRLNLGISLEQLFAAIDSHNRLLPAGQISTDGPRIFVRVDSDLSDMERLAAVPIPVGERIVRLDEIATLRRGYEDPPGYLVRAGGEDAILLGAIMEPGANGLELGRALQDFLAGEHARLPLGMKLARLTDQSESIARSVTLFQVKFLIAVGVVLLVSAVTIGLRAALVVGVAIPVTLGLTFFLMRLAGHDLNLVTLGALVLALGLLVDDAIISIEMMLVKMAEGLDRLRAATFVWTTTAAPMLFGTLVTVAGFVPIGFAASSTGEYAGGIFWVLCFALILSWFVAVIFTPYLGARLLPAPAPDAHNAQGLYQTPVYRRLRAVIEGCVRRRKTVVGATVLLLALSVFGMIGPVQKQFFPASNRPEVLIDVHLPQGSSIAATDAMARRVEALLDGMPGIRNYSAYVGAGAPRFFISATPQQPDPAFARVLVISEDVAAREEIIRRVEAHIAEGAFPGVRVRVSRLRYGPPVEWPVTLRVHGDDPIQLRRIAHEVRTVMAGHPNIRLAHLEWDERAPVLRLRTDPERLRLIGLTPRAVAEQMQTELHGSTATIVREDSRSVELQVRGSESYRRDSGSLELKTRDGRKIPIAQLGDFEVRFEDPVLRRYNRRAMVPVHAEIEGGQVNDVTADLWRALEPLRAGLPAGYGIAVGGSVERSATANAAIRKLQPLVVVLMMSFIMLQMRSFAGTFVVLATAPLGLIGAVAALLVSGMPFGFVATLGIIGLAGILMRNTLILTQQVSDNLAANMAPYAAVVEAAVRRARPVVLTALAAALAFVPLAFNNFWGPLAVVLIGGVVVGTAVTLLFVPALYALWFRLSAIGADCPAAAGSHR